MLAPNTIRCDADIVKTNVAPHTVTDLQTHRIRRQPVVGALINEYHHAA